MSDDSRRLDPADMARVPFLAGLLPAEAEALCAAAREQRFEEDDVVFREGDPGNELFVLIEGEIAIELTVSGDEPRRLAALDSGTVFGEVNFLLGTERTATARALRPSRCLAFDRDGVDQLDGIGRQALANVLETTARVLALRLTRADAEIARLASLLAEHAPSQAPDAGELARRRGRLLHAGEHD